jgi:hypothetical protein
VYAQQALCLSVVNASLHHTYQMVQIMVFRLWNRQAMTCYAHRRTPHRDCVLACICQLVWLLLLPELPCMLLSMLLSMLHVLQVIMYGPVPLKLAVLWIWQGACSGQCRFAAHQCSYWAS